MTGSRIALVTGANQGLGQSPREVRGEEPGQRPAADTAGRLELEVERLGTVVGEEVEQIDEVDHADDGAGTQTHHAEG